MNEVPVHSEWEPISKADLMATIAADELRMDASVRAFWERIKIEPEKWSLPPWGDLGGGFWVVGLIGQQVVWFNDIEDGFNCSNFDNLGCIKDYWCNQDDVQQCLCIHFFELTGSHSEPVLKAVYAT